MLLIGIGNKARNGKDTAANYFSEFFIDWKVLVSPLANALKKYCRDHHDELLLQWRLKHNDPKGFPSEKQDGIYGYTEILQDTGQFVRTHYSQNYWIDKCFEHIDGLQPDIAIIPDVRYKNEAQAVRDRDGILIQVIRVNEDGSQFIDPSRDPKHPSEIELDDYLGWDYIVRARDLNQLYHKLHGIGEQLIFSKGLD